MTRCSRQAQRALAGMLLLLVAGGHVGSALASDKQKPAAGKTKAHAKSVVPDSRQMEHDLQQLDWPKFRQVVESVPKLKADVDAYGPLGWKYVEAKYRTYPWQKNIDKLDDGQKRQLAQLIRAAQR